MVAQNRKRSDEMTVSRTPRQPENPASRCSRTRGFPDSMIPTATGQPKYPPGTRVRVTQQVRIGHRRWQTQVEGVVEHEGRRPVGGIEMGGKASYIQQPTLRLRRDDGEVTEVAVDSATEVQIVTAPTATVQAVTNPTPSVRT
jgi:hypothetical protein